MMIQKRMFSACASCIRKRSIPVWVSIVVVSFSLSVSEAAPPATNIAGLGATTCAQFETEAAADPRVQRDYLAWAQGFMSGVLISRPAGVDEGLELVPSSFPLLKQLDFLRDYCQQNPREGFADAAIALYKRLRKEGGT